MIREPPSQIPEDIPVKLADFRHDVLANTAKLVVSKIVRTSALRNALISTNCVPDVQLPYQQHESQQNATLYQVLRATIVERCFIADPRVVKPVDRPLYNRPTRVCQMDCSGVPRESMINKVDM